MPCFIQRRGLGIYQVNLLLLSNEKKCIMKFGAHEFSYIFFPIFPFYYMDVQSDALIQFFSGIDVGDQFYSRAEMVVLGIHSHWLNGIDYMGMKYQGKVTAADISVQV